MRYPPDHKQATHRRILDSAGRSVRRRGFAGSGVDAVMHDAGLTVGGFYAHFDSKAALLEEVMAKAVEEMRTILLGGLDESSGADWLQAVARRYLSRSHRDALEQGCAVPSVISELARNDDALRDVFQAKLEAVVDEMSAKMPAGPAGLSPRERTLAVLATFLGGLALARAVRDDELSGDIMAACRRLAAAEAYQP